MNSTEKRQRIKELLKRKQQPIEHPKEKENAANKMTDTMTTATTPITNSTNITTEKLVEQLPIALKQTSMAIINNTMDEQDKTITNKPNAITCVCVVCGKDLSCCSLKTREMHLNACLDDKIEIETNFTLLERSDAKQQGNKKQQNSLFAIAIVCPCCNRTFKAKTEKGKLDHFKKCGKKLKYTPSKMLEFLQELKIKYGR